MTAPDQPGDGLPATRLDDTRAALFAALQRVWTALGWPAERAYEFPPSQLYPPAAWVDVPTVHQATTSTAGGVAATYPVVFVVDGTADSQVQLQDRLLAYGWQALSAVKVGEDGRKHSATVQSGGPEDVDAGGAVLRGLVFRVQVGLTTKTLCPQPLTQQDEQE